MSHKKSRSRMAPVAAAQPGVAATTGPALAAAKAASGSTAAAPTAPHKSSGAKSRKGGR